MTLSKKTVQALEILEAYPGLQPREFAKLMWPESPGWKRPSKCGNNGMHRGGGMYRAAGGFLGKLCKRGLAYWKYIEAGRREYYISPLGTMELQELRGQE